MIVLLSGIIGAELSPYRSLTTLPMAVMVIGGAVFSIPAALLMKRIGRRPGSMIGAGLAITAACCGMYGIAVKSFLLFCLATLFFGGSMSFVQQYRFAATESVDRKHVGRAVSWVMIGGIIAAFLGPELVRSFKDLLPYGLYTGSFAALASVNIISLLLLTQLEIPLAPEEIVDGEERPLTRIIRQPLFFSAVSAGMVSYGVMTFIMTATPVSMHIMDGFSLDETAKVIQSHIVAMFLPSLFSGWLIDRLGLIRIMAAGILLMAACALISLAEHQFIHYWSGLVLLGIGWNFLFVGSTAMLTRTYRPPERFKVQAINDFTVYGFQAAASLYAGALIFMAGWQTVNIITVPVLLLMLIEVFRIRPYLSAPLKEK
jgi:MFS family permease